MFIRVVHYRVQTFKVRNIPRIFRQKFKIYLKERLLNFFELVRLFLALFVRIPALSL